MCRLINTTTELYVFIHFSASFCSGHYAFDLARDHTPWKCPLLLLLLLTEGHVTRMTEQRV